MAMLAGLRFRVNQIQGSMTAFDSPQISNVAVRKNLETAVRHHQGHRGLKLLWLIGVVPTEVGRTELTQDSAGNVDWFEKGKPLSDVCVLHENA